MLLPPAVTAYFFGGGDVPHFRFPNLFAFLLFCSFSGPLHRVSPLYTEVRHLSFFALEYDMYVSNIIILLKQIYNYLTYSTPLPPPSQSILPAFPPRFLRDIYMYSM